MNGQRPVRCETPQTAARFAAVGLLLQLGGLRVLAVEPQDAPMVKPSPDDAALARRALSAAELARETPGREFVNFITANWPSNAVLTLQGGKPGTSNDFVTARRIVAELADHLEAAPSWPRPRTLPVAMAGDPPVIDGKLDEPAWQAASRFEATYPFNSTNPVSPPSTVWRMMWDQQNLYIAFDCKDTDIQAPPMERDQPVFQHDCVEVFLLPDFRMGVYWEICVGPTGCIFDALHSKRFEDWGSLGRPDQDVQDMKTGWRIVGTPNQGGDTDGGYVVELAIPFRELPSFTRGNPPRAGDTMHIMLARIDRNGERTAPCAFQPLLAWGHNIWNHYAIRLEPPRPTAPPPR